MCAGNPCVLEVASSVRMGVTNGDVLKELMSNCYRKCAFTISIIP